MGLKTARSRFQREKCREGTMRGALEVEKKAKTLGNGIHSSSSRSI
jgi:hypothetical protein